VEVDLTAAARRVDPDAARAWLAEQRVFISSAMTDTREERQSVAATAEAEGTQPVWFEELGRDANAEEAYIVGVDSSTIYVGVLNEVYGTMLQSGFSPTEAEYMRARDGGKRTVVYVAEDASEREGHLRRFIERVRVFLTTEDYKDADDLARRLRRRLHELAAEALSPWVKLGDLVFRADLIQERDDTILLHARVNEDISFAIEQLRGQQWGRARVRFTYAAGVADGEVSSIQRTTRAGGTSTLEITLERATRPQASSMRASFSGIAPDDLVEAGLRHQLFGDLLPQAISSGFGFTADTGIDADDLRAAFALPNETVEPITRLVLTEGLVGGGHSLRVSRVFVGPRVADARRLSLEWLGGGSGSHAAPTRQVIEGDWRV
jgi:Domain of unknown function (DUF4062)